jgi:adenylate cyclase
VLAPACIQGEIFSVEAIAAILNKPFEAVFELLNESICKQHQLIKFHAVHQTNKGRVTYFQFRHVLFQLYLYNELNEAEKMRYHSQVGDALEKLYRDNLNQYPEMAHNLARHFELSGQVEKAVRYFTLAGKNAVILTANQEALRHYYHALELLKALPPSEKRDELELDIQVSLAPPLTMAIGHGAPEIEKAYSRAEALCENIKDEEKILPFLWLFKSFRLGRAEHAEADRLFDRITRIARNTDDPALQALCALQVTKFYQGKFKESKILLERAGLWHDVNLQRFVAQKFGMAPAVVALCHLYNCLWVMGYTEQASKVNEEAFKLAYATDHPISIAYVACRACWVGGLKNEIGQVQSNADIVYNLATKYGSEIFECVSWFWKNWAWFHLQGMRDEFLEGMQAGMDGFHGTHSKFNRPAFLGLFAEACLQAGKLDRGLVAVEESIRMGEENKEFWYQAESWRIKGELILAQDKTEQKSDETYFQAETCFKNAYTIARQLEAKSFELRAAIKMAELGLERGNSKKQLQTLSKTLGWFTEGLNSPDLEYARNLLSSR